MDLESLRDVANTRDWNITERLIAADSELYGDYLRELAESLDAKADVQRAKFDGLIEAAQRAVAANFGDPAPEGMTPDINLGPFASLKLGRGRLVAVVQRVPEGERNAYYTSVRFVSDDPQGGEEPYYQEALTGSAPHVPSPLRDPEGDRDLFAGLHNEVNGEWFYNLQVFAKMVGDTEDTQNMLDEVLVNRQLNDWYHR